MDDRSQRSLRGATAAVTPPVVPAQRRPGESIEAPDVVLVEGRHVRRLTAVTVIVPTRNESGNVAPLVHRLERALDGGRAEVLFVDDSDDDTPEQVLRAARTSRLRVRLHHRGPGARSGGLGGAVLAGLARSDAAYVVVMDGDLQHPPEVVPELVATAEREQADVVVASRHVVGGSTDGLANVVRVAVSGSATALTRGLFPKRLSGVTDPMSGFFLLRRSAIDTDLLRPDGFKILLEVLARTPGLVKREVPFTFGERLAGDSKASVAEGARFVRQVGRLWLARLVQPRSPGRLSPGVVGRGLGFLTVGLTGLVVNSLLMWGLVEKSGLGLGIVLAAVIATQGSSTWNFVLIDRLVYSGPKRSTPWRRGLGFLGMSNLMLILRIPILAVLVGGLGLHYLIANGLSLVVGFLARFSTQERLSLRR